VANGQPAFASYRREPDGSYQAHAIQVLSTAAVRIRTIIIFLEPGLFTTFGLPRSLDAMAVPTPRLLLGSRPSAPCARHSSSS
jgi:RNA polymerase sigma-70 factor (ECF subfamily)